MCPNRDYEVARRAHIECKVESLVCQCPAQATGREQPKGGDALIVTLDFFSHCRSSWTCTEPESIWNMLYKSTALMFLLQWIGETC